MENFKQWSDHNSHNTESRPQPLTESTPSPIKSSDFSNLMKWPRVTIPLFNEDDDVFLIWWSNRSSGLPWWLSSKESACNAAVSGDAGSISGPERSPGGGHGSPLQCPCLEKPMDRGAWWATVHGVAQSQTQLKQLSTHACTQLILIAAVLKKWRHRKVNTFIQGSFHR